jgi:hypothetical protein
MVVISDYLDNLITDPAWITKVRECSKEVWPKACKLMRLDTSQGRADD